MDIKVERGELGGVNYYERYAKEQLDKYFSSYPFIESAKVFFRGDKHPTKKVKLHVKLKGKDVFAEAEGDRHDIALDNAVEKLRSQMEKYKSKRYKNAS